MDTIMMGLICGGVVLIVPLVALIKASGTAKELYDLKQKVQRLQDRLNDLSDQFADTESVPRPLGQAERPTETKQAALAKPEPKHFTLPSDLKESRDAALAKKDRRRKMASGSPPIIQSPNTVPIAVFYTPLTLPTKA